MCCLFYFSLIFFSNFKSSFFFFSNYRPLASPALGIQAGREFDSSYLPCMSPGLSSIQLMVPANNA